MDFDVSIFIITSDKQYIPASEYDKSLDGGGVFVMLTNEELNTEFGDDNSICIYRDWFDEIKYTMCQLDGLIKFKLTNVDKHVSCPWQIEDKEIPNTFKLNDDTDTIGTMWNVLIRERCMRKYLDGYRTNQEVIQNVVPLLDGRSVEEYLPAFMVAHHTKVEFDGKVLNGYLPAIGQLLFIAKNIENINTSLRMIDKRNKIFKIETSDNQMSDVWCSATEYNYDCVWCVYEGKTYYSYYKVKSLGVLPIFSI